MIKILDNKINELSYEEAFEKLQEIVGLLEDGKISLDDSIKFYEYGMSLKMHCEKKLKNAEMKIKTVLDKSKNSED